MCVTAEGDDVLRYPSKIARFVVFEGIDGSGKTTQALLLNYWLISKGYKTVFTQEPTQHSVTGALLRIVLTSRETLPKESYLTLFLLDRKYHTEKIIRPSLESGHVVISDRYHFSTLAYQTAQGIPREKIDALVDLLEVNIETPDITILIDIDPETAISRIGDRKKAVSLFEKKDFLSRVRENYLKLAEEFNFLVIDGSEDVFKIHRKIIRKVRKYFP